MSETFTARVGWSRLYRLHHVQELVYPLTFRRFQGTSQYLYCKFTYFRAFEHHYGNPLEPHGMFKRECRVVTTLHREVSSSFFSDPPFTPRILQVVIRFCTVIWKIVVCCFSVMPGVTNNSFVVRIETPTSFVIIGVFRIASEHDKGFTIMFVDTDSLRVGEVQICVSQ